MKDQIFIKKLEEVRKEIRRRYKIPKYNCKYIALDCPQCRAYMLTLYLENQIEVLNMGEK